MNGLCVMSEDSQVTRAASLASPHWSPSLAACRLKGLRRIAAAAIFIAVATLALAQQRSEELTHQEFVALWLYKLPLFTQWPKETFADETAPFILGILGDDPFGQDPAILEGRIHMNPGEPALVAVLRYLGNSSSIQIKTGNATVSNRKLVVNHFTTVQEDLTACHVLFIGASEQKHISDIIHQLENSTVLTVAEMDRFIDQSGIINFVFKKSANLKEKPGFEINFGAMKKNKLKLDPQLDPLTVRYIKG